MPKSDKAVGLVVALFVAGILVAFLFPVAIGAMSGAETQTLNQSVGDTDTLQPGLNVTLDASTADTEANYTVNASGDTASATVAEGTNETVTVDGVDVTIEVTDASANNATATFEYPTTYGWGSGAASLWVILPLILVLVAFIWFVTLAMKQA